MKATGKTMNKFNMIVAADNNWYIGKNGTLLANIPEDMEFFKKTTMNKIVIMGENTQASLPNGIYLKNRVNIILTDKIKSNAERVIYTDDTEESLYTYATDLDRVYDVINLITEDQNDSEEPLFPNKFINEVFVIGGGQTYRYFLKNDLIDTVYLTKILYDFKDADTSIPDIIKDYGFKLSEVIVPESESVSGYRYTILKYTKE